jgi:pantoate--beta-alanine ligase
MGSGVPVLQALGDAKQALLEAGFSVDYVALVDEATLEPVNEPIEGTRLIAAATIAGTRLIDNLPL